MGTVERNRLYSQVDLRSILSPASDPLLILSTFLNTLGWFPYLHILIENIIPHRVIMRIKWNNICRTFRVASVVYVVNE